MVPRWRIVAVLLLSEAIHSFVISPSSASVRGVVRLAAEAKNSSEISHENVAEYRNRMGDHRKNSDKANRPVRECEGWMLSTHVSLLLRMERV